MPTGGHKTVGKRHYSTVKKNTKNKIDPQNKHRLEMFSKLEFVFMKHYVPYHQFVYQPFSSGNLFLSQLTKTKANRCNSLRDIFFGNVRCPKFAKGINSNNAKGDKNNSPDNLIINFYQLSKV